MNKICKVVSVCCDTSSTNPVFRVVIPQEAQKKLKIKKGDKLLVSYSKNTVIFSIIQSSERRFSLRVKQ